MPRPSSPLTLSRLGVSIRPWVLSGSGCRRDPRSPPCRWSSCAIKGAPASRCVTSQACARGRQVSSVAASLRGQGGYPFAPPRIRVSIVRGTVPAKLSSSRRRRVRGARASKAYPPGKISSSIGVRWAVGGGREGGGARRAPCARGVCLDRYRVLLLTPSGGEVLFREPSHATPPLRRWPPRVICWRLGTAQGKGRSRSVAAWWYRNPLDLLARGRVMPAGSKPRERVSQPNHAGARSSWVSGRAP